MTLWEAIKAAHDAEKAHEAALRASGWTYNDAVYAASEDDKEARKRLRVSLRAAIGFES